MEFIKQCKGTDSDTLPTLESWWTKGKKWYKSIKYDGQYAQIHITKGFVMFYTSSGKPYTNDALAKDLLCRIPETWLPIILEAEYLGNGEGKLGGRSDAAVVTTLRTAFAKGVDISMEHKIRIFDIIEDESFEIRLKSLRNLEKVFDTSELIQIVSYDECESIADAKITCAKLVSQGYEGIYCKSALHTQETGKRVKTAFKFKKKNEAEVTIIGVDEGTGKYEGQIGAFICKDDNGMLVNVGSGLTDSIRAFTPSSVISKRIRINYERIDQTYIFPIFIDFV